MHNRTMIDIKRGRKGLITGLGKGRGFRAKMMAMGIRPGAEITMVGGHGKGPRILRVNRQKVMIGAEMLSHIYVNEEDN